MVVGNMEEAGALMKNLKLKMPDVECQWMQPGPGRVPVRVYSCSAHGTPMCQTARSWSGPLLRRRPAT
jgi:hypothetical protein